LHKIKETIIQGNFH